MIEPVPPRRGPDLRERDLLLLEEVERPKKLAENVAAKLLNYITVLGLEPGTPLAPQVSMMENLDVGRASLREALRFLEMHGFIELRAGRNGGPMVGDMSGKNFANMSSMYFQALGVTVSEVLDARVLLEPAMVGALAERGVSKPDLLKPFLMLPSPEDASEGHHPSLLDFHSTIAELSGNAVLRLVSESMRDIYNGVAREVHLSEEEAAEIEVVHRDIAAAILDHDAPAAQALMQDHMGQIRSVLETRYAHLLDARITWP